MAVPNNSLRLTLEVYQKVIPTVRRELEYWKKRAEMIPNGELRRQALQSMEGKDFHCEGGAILSLISEERWEEVIKFIVSYQTICDYLDNLCDRSKSNDPKDFMTLHNSLRDALDLEQEVGDYYLYRSDREDGGYLKALVGTCRNFLLTLSNYPFIREGILELCQLYCDLQVHKHVIKEERLHRLQRWYENHKKAFPYMDWYEFSACCGSTLGIFCLVSYGAREDFRPEHAKKILAGYFPHLQGFHILLDYLIDQKEDQEGGDLNFCAYYRHPEELFQRLTEFFREADRMVGQLPHPYFHRMVNRGLLGVYLSDEKVNQQPIVKEMVEGLLKLGGRTSYFFYLNGKGYRLWKRLFQQEKERSESC